MSTTTVAPHRLPAVIRTYLTAHRTRDVDTAIRAFTPAAVVVDEGETFRGTSDILRFLREAGAEYTYTTELVGAEHVDDTHWVVTNRIEGDFPGGIAELEYRFTIEGEAIAELLIGA